VAPGCPYDAFEPANLHFCEVDLCGWITQPANTWSNLGFLVAAVAIVVASRGDRDRRAAVLAPVAVAAGLSSAAFHATSTFVGQAFDQGVMLLESGLFIVLNLGRLRPAWSARRLVALYAVIVGGSIGVLVLVHAAGIALFVGHVVTFLGLEVVIYRRCRRRTYRWLIAVGIAFAASWSIWWLDLTGAICDPDNHVFTGHAAWHLLGALQYYFWYRHYREA